MSALIRHKDGGLGMFDGACQREASEMACPHCTRDMIQYHLNEARRLVNFACITDRASDVPKAEAAIKEAYSYVFGMTFKEAKR